MLTDKAYPILQVLSKEKCLWRLLLVYIIHALKHGMMHCSVMFLITAWSEELPGRNYLGEWVKKDNFFVIIVKESVFSTDLRNYQDVKRICGYIRNRSRVC